MVRKHSRIGQAQLDKFRTEMEAKRADPYAVLLKQSKLPMSLLGRFEGIQGQSLAGGEL